MDDGDFILGRLDRLEKRLEALTTKINSHYNLFHGTTDSDEFMERYERQEDLGVSDSPDKPV